MSDFKTPRGDFPALATRTYLDSASKSPLAKPVAARLGKYFALCTERGSDYPGWWRTVDSTRAKTASLLGASPAEIAFASSSTHAINIVAQGLSWRPGDNVVVAEEEFPSNLYPWLALAEKGVDIRIIPPRRDGYPLSAYQEMADAGTRLIALSHVQANTGYRSDLAAMAAYCRDNDILLLADATQSCGAVPIDVKACGVDFLCASTYKWLLGIDGLAILYIDRARLQQLRFSQLGWAGRCQPNDNTHHRMDYPDEARRFELGNPNFTAIHALESGLDYLAGIGVEAIFAKITALGNRLREGLAKIPGVSLAGDHGEAHRSAIVTVGFAGGPEEASRVHSTLARAGVAAALKPQGVRFSFNFFNTAEDIDRACAALADAVRPA